ncbi:hypothetical protein JCM31447_09660 [Fluviispira sanaruensis]|uniref:Uncharacterized protein n=1 Tax=Fluviispira sanaruensis TaxID=2493639 RepID=A0A4P2VT58_FLUSA|nr:hypothetical protein JCM31447_09660 [Fluviispira sanaruensis]
MIKDLSVLLSPERVVEIIGKIHAIHAQITKVKKVLLLNQIINSGIIETIGVVCKITIYGEMALSRILY